MSSSLQLPMIRSRKGSSNCFRLIDSRDRMAFKNCWDARKSWSSCRTWLVHYLQWEGQPAQLSQGEDCLMRVNCSRIVWYIWTNRKEWASDLFRGACSEYQYLSWHPGVFSKFTKFTKAFRSLIRKPGFSGSLEVKDMCGGDFWGNNVREEVAHTWQPYRPAVKAKTWKSHNMACFLCVIPLLEPVCYIGKRVIDWMSILYITGYLLPT